MLQKYICVKKNSSGPVDGGKEMEFCIRFWNIVYVLPKLTKSISINVFIETLILNSYCHDSNPMILISIIGFSWVFSSSEFNFP